MEDLFPSWQECFYKGLKPLPSFGCIKSSHRFSSSRCILSKKERQATTQTLAIWFCKGFYLLPKPLWGVLWTNQYFLKCQTHQQALLCHLFGNPSFVLLSHKTVGGFYCRVSFLFHSCQGSILGMCLWGLASGRDSNDAWEGDRENKHKHRENVPMPWDFGSKYGHDMKDLMFFLLAVRISTFNVFPWLHPESCSLLSYYIIQYIYICTRWFKLWPFYLLVEGHSTLERVS